MLFLGAGLLRRHRRLRDRLRAVLDGGDHEITHLIKETTMHERYYTEEQLQQLAERRQQLGEEGMEKAQRGWADLIAGAGRELARPRAGGLGS